MMMQLEPLMLHHSIVRGVRIPLCHRTMEPMTVCYGIGGSRTTSSWTPSLRRAKEVSQNTCCQLFVMDKGFLYVVPTKRKLEVMQAVNQFTKEVGAPDALVCDMASKQTSAEVKQFCNTNGTTL